MLCQKLQILVDAANACGSDALSPELPADAFAEFAGGTAALEALHEALRLFLENPSHELPLVDSSRLVLHLGSWYTLFLSLQGAPSRHLYSHPFHGLLCLMTDATICIDTYHLPPDWCADRYDPTVRLKLNRRIALHRGEVMTFDGRREAIDIVPNSVDAVLLKLYSHPTSDLEWAFDRSTLQPIGAVAADP